VVDEAVEEGFGVIAYRNSVQKYTQAESHLVRLRVYGTQLHSSRSSFESKFILDG
jgi:hypothetical protein